MTVPMLATTNPHFEGNNLLAVAPIVAVTVFDKMRRWLEIFLRLHCACYTDVRTTT